MFTLRWQWAKHNDRPIKSQGGSTPQTPGSSVTSAITGRALKTLYEQGNARIPILNYRLR
jgi:hypothetical protein